MSDLGFALITPDDDADLESGATQGLSFVTAGDIKVTMANGDVVVIPNGALAAGVIHRIRVKRVWATGTGADGLVAWYTAQQAWVDGGTLPPSEPPEGPQ